MEIQEVNLREEQRVDAWSDPKLTVVGYLNQQAVRQWVELQGANLGEQRRADAWSGAGRDRLPIASSAVCHTRVPTTVATR